MVNPEPSEQQRFPSGDVFKQLKGRQKQMRQNTHWHMSTAVGELETSSSS